MGRRPGVARKLRALDPVADLVRRLKRHGLPAAPAAVRAITRAWWAEQGFAEQIVASGTAEVGKRVGAILIEQRLAEAKRAGIVVLGELVGADLHGVDLGALAALLRDGHLASRSLVDAFARRVLGRMLARDAIRAQAIYELAQWRHAETAWQRRAMCVAFVDLAPRARSIDGLCEAILAICASVVWSVDDLDQRAVGWVLRELSRAEPERVAAFFRRYARFMSPRCARLAVARLASARRGELLAYHRRATTIF